MHLIRCDDCGALFDPADADPKQERELDYPAYCPFCWENRVALEQDTTLAEAIEMEALCIE